MTSNISSSDEILFEVETPLSFRVRTTVSYWELITTVKHSIMRGREADVRETLTHPDEVRLSKSDASLLVLSHGWG